MSLRRNIAKTALEVRVSISAAPFLSLARQQRGATIGRVTATSRESAKVKKKKRNKYNSYENTAELGGGEETGESLALSVLFQPPFEFPQGHYDQGGSERGRRRCWVEGGAI